MRTLIALLTAAVCFPCLAAVPTTQNTDASPRAALSRKVPEVRLSAVALDDAIEFVRDFTGANIHVNWKALELINVTRQMPVTVRLTDVSSRRCLRSILDETGAGELLTWYIDEGVIEITTREIADSKMITRVYPVADLVAEVPNFAGPSFNMQNQTQTSGGGGGGGGGGGQSIFGGSGGDTAQQEQNTTRQDRADSLVKLIMETVHPDVWRDNGGTASIRYFNGHLIVTAPRSVHEAISGKAE